MSTFEERKEFLCRNAYRKLEGIGVSFGLPAYSDDIPTEKVENYFYNAWHDSLRDFKMTEDSFDITEYSEEELIFENRLVYHMIKKFRYSSATFFKFSSSMDGRSVDRTGIFKNITAILDELDKEFKDYRGGHIGSIWARTYDDFLYDYWNGR